MENPFISLRPAIIVFAVTVAILLCPVVPANASICVLKNGDYALSGTPCSTADGNGDDIIDLIYNVGEDIELDVVYENETSCHAELFTYLMFYDTANMDGTTTTCNADPNNYFSDNMAPTLGLPQCTTPNGGAAGDAVDDQSIKIVTQTYMNFSGDNWPDSNPNFILDQIVFDSGYTTPSADHNAGSEVYTIDFSTTGGSPTDVGCIYPSGDRCGILTGAQQCDTLVVTPEPVLQSRIFIDQPCCYAAPPGPISVGKCVYTGESGSCDSGSDAAVEISITLPSGCFGDPTCSTFSTDCGTMGVDFESADGTPVTEYTSTTYTDTTAKVGDSLSYTFVGVDTSGSCCDSSGLTSSGACGNTTVTATGGTCQCGDPPQVTIADPSEAELGDSCTSCKTFLSGTDIEIEYTVTDEDGILPDSISSIYFFYTDDLSVPPQVQDITSTLDSEGNFYGTIPKEYVNKCTDLYFAVIVTDEDLLTDAYPDGFTCSATAPTAECMTTAANVNKINRDYCPPSAFAFEEGYEPYPDQFPFRASSGEPLNIYFSTTERARVSMRIYTMDGMLVRTLENDPDTNIRYYHDCTGEECNLCNWRSGCRWDGSNSAGGSNIVQNGMYIINIYAISEGYYSGQTIDFTKGLVVMK